MPRKIVSGPLEPIAIISIESEAIEQLRDADVVTTLANTTKTLSLANTEYSVAIPKCMGYEFRARTSAAIRYAYTTGKVATPTDPYLTLAAGEQFYMPSIIDSHTLYLASAEAGTVVEILIYGV